MQTDPLPRNPFSPTFGTSPYILAGRDRILADIDDTFDDGPGSPSRTVLFTGARGMGKTVMLNEYQDLAAKRGWLIIAEGARPGLIDRLTSTHLPQLLNDHTTGPSKITTAGFTLPVVGGGATSSWTDRYPLLHTLRSQLNLLLDALAPYQTGVVITVDEIQSADRDDLRQLGEVLQFARREDRDLAFAGAGLNAAVDDLLNDDVVTFLRRAERHQLANLSYPDVYQAIAASIRDNQRSITDTDLARAAQASDGYPYLIQLIGHRIWLQHPRLPHISSDDVTTGIHEAIQRLADRVHAPALHALTGSQRRYLSAMAANLDADGAATTRTIAQHLGVTAQKASRPRARLIADGIIEPAGWGRVRYTIPYLADTLANPQPPPPTPHQLPTRPLPPENIDIPPAPVEPPPTLRPTHNSPTPAP